MSKFLAEGLNYLDMEGQVEPKITVDEYEAKMGKDKDIVTVTFVVKNKLAGDDLVGWFERGYGYVLDASVSDGEFDKDKYLVFVEMDRRSIVPERIIELLKDLETLTGIPLKDYEVQVDGETHDADVDILKQVIITSPLEYQKEKEKEEELNEYRELSGIMTKKLYEDDAYIKSIKAMAGM